MDSSINQLIQLERTNKWQDAVHMLYREWQQNPMDMECLIRLICECWYIIMMWDCCIPSSSISRDECEGTFFNAVRFGDEHFFDNAMYLCIVGYIMTLTPYLFPKNNDDVATIEKKGLNYLSRAKTLRPNDPICSILHSGFVNSVEQHCLLQQEFSSVLKEIKWNESRVSQYFRDIIMLK